VAETFVIARNPDPASSLPYLIRVPVQGQELILKARDVWPRTSKVYCHRAEAWPDDAEILDEVPVRSCVRRGVAVDLVLERHRESRSQFVFTTIHGREGIFWQSAHTTKKARPGIRVPTRRASRHEDLKILVDTRERYPYRFAHQQATLERRALPAGDYGVELDGEIVGAVERKSMADLSARLVDGSLPYVLADLATLPRAAVVIEDRYADIFKLEHVKPGFVAELLAAVQVRYPSVPIIFCETRSLAEEWAYRFLGAARAYAAAESPIVGSADRAALSPSSGSSVRRPRAPRRQASG
jgi:ERCC4 domain-containing protein